MFGLYFTHQVHAMVPGNEPDRTPNASSAPVMVAAHSQIVSISAPLRLTFAGGGTDLPAHYESFGARVLSAAIEHRVVVRIHPGQPNRREQREDDYLGRFLRNHPGLSLTASSELEPGSGLGGSGALAVCLVAAEAVARTGTVPPVREIAADAYEFERVDMNAPVGFQDSYSAAFGGVSDMTVEPGTSGPVAVRSRPDLYRAAEKMIAAHLVFAKVGATRRSAPLLHAFSTGMTGSGFAIGTASVDEMETAILDQDPDRFGRLLGRQWVAKVRAAGGVTNPVVERALSTATGAGASGAKIMGAGGSGYLMACTPGRKDRLRDALTAAGYPVAEFTLSERGLLVEGIS